jgi:3-deoxy-D-manno-octulosonic-acid transferase
MALYLRLVARTSRFSGEITRSPVVLTFWHEYNLAVFAVAVRMRSDLRHASFSTQGFRGAVVDAMLEHSTVPMRILPLPLESDRAAGRAFALRLGELGEAGWSPVVTPDGPFGPYRVVKPGALIVARASGLPIQPWAIEARPLLRLPGRWDHHIIPLPFGRLRVIGGEPITIAERERLSPRVAQLQAELDRTALLADRSPRAD